MPTTKEDSKSHTKNPIPPAALLQIYSGM